MSTDGDNIVRGRIRRWTAVHGHPRKSCEPKIQERSEESFHHSAVDDDDIVLHDDVVDE